MANPQAENPGLAKQVTPKAPLPEFNPLTTRELVVCVSLLGISYEIATRGPRSAHAFYINHDADAFLAIIGWVAILHVPLLAIASRFRLNRVIVGSILGTVVWAWILACGIVLVRPHDQTCFIALVATIISGPAIALRCRIPYWRILVFQLVLGSLVFFGLSVMQESMFRE